MITPNKKGSFEDYLWAMGNEARCRGWRYVICVLGPVSVPLHQWLTTSGCELICLDDKQFENTNYIAELLKTYRADILHTHFIGPTDTALLTFKLKWRGKIVFTDHSSNSLSPDKQSNIFAKQIRGLKRFIVSQCIDLYLPVSDFVAERIVNNVPQAKSKVRRLYNGVDLERFEPIHCEHQRQKLKSSVLGINDGKPVVSFIGQIIVEKGIDMFLDAIASMLDGGVQCHFIIVGDGIARVQVEEFCEQLQYQPSVQYLGLRSDVNEILAITDVFVMPSQWGEAFGLTACEAAASGVPVVASRVGGLSEVVIDNYNGLLISLGSQSELEESIRLLVEHPAKRDEFGRNGRLHAQKHFLLSDMLMQTFDHYQRILSNFDGYVKNEYEPELARKSSGSLESN